MVRWTHVQLESLPQRQVLSRAMGGPQAGRDQADPYREARSRYGRAAADRGTSTAHTLHRVRPGRTPLADSRNARRRDRLAGVPSRVVDHRVNVDPTAALSNQLDADRSPVSLHAIAPTLESGQRKRLVADVQRQVEVTMQAGLSTDQSVNTSTASDTDRSAGLGQVRQYPQHLAEIHALACTVSLRHLRRSHSLKPESEPNQQPSSRSRLPSAIDSPNNGIVHSSSGAVRSALSQLAYLPQRVSFG
jgi:hypothetical protein